MQITDHGIYQDAVVEPITSIRRLNLSNDKLPKYVTACLNLKVGQVMIVFDFHSTHIPSIANERPIALWTTKVSPKNSERNTEGRGRGKGLCQWQHVKA